LIVKGKAQGQPGKLAKHLCRTDHNERVRVLDIEGLNALTIPDALRELDDLGAAAQTRRTLYHGIIAPRVNEQMTDEQREIAVRSLAEKMALENQPYIVIGHLKKDEGEHYHVIFSRIDQANARGISDSHNYRKHEELARDLEHRFGFAHTRGAHVRDKSEEARPGRTPDHWEMQQAQRTGVTIDQARQTITAAWRTTRSGAELIDALSQEGFTVARGDRRDFVLVDEAGGVHGLTRRIDGARAKDVRERMADVYIEQLPDVAQAKRRQRELSQAAELEKNGREFLSAAERLRNEELEAQREARGNHPLLNHADREIAAAMRMLKALGTETNIVGSPVAARRVERPEAAVLGGTRVAGPSPEATPRPSVEAENRNPIPNWANTPAPHPSAVPTRESIMAQLDREARERGDAPIVVKIVPKPQLERTLKLELPRPRRQDEPRP